MSHDPKLAAQAISARNYVKSMMAKLYSVHATYNKDEEVSLQEAAVELGCTQDI